MSRIFSGLWSLLEDVGTGAAVLVTAVVACAVGVVATLQVTGGTPYSQEDLDRRSAAYEAQVARPAAPQPAADASTDSAEVTDLQEELEDERERADRIERTSGKWEAKWTASQRRIAQLRRQLAKLQDATEGAVGPDGLPISGGTLPGAAGATDPEATETTVSGTLTTTWTLTDAARPWPDKCTRASEAYAVRVVDGAGKPVATGSVTGRDLVDRTEKKGVLTLVCALTYQVVLPLPATSTLEFQSVAKEAPTTPLYSALVPGPVAASGVAPDLVASLYR